ncbi:hypothetical protein [Coleofasciculus sp. H7-2]|uniref:hypothetical protein n=1 Tax=Coleofasciculus sp. H7-2 TaxID=3351545 RepID=UPI0036725A96
MYVPEQQTFLIKLWDAESGRELRTLRSRLIPKVSDRNSDGSPRYRSDSNIVFSADGKRLVGVVGNNSTRASVGLGLREKSPKSLSVVMERR